MTNSSNLSVKTPFPDITMDDKPSLGGKLDKVGMENVELPVQIKNNQGLMSVPAKANLYVSLDKESAKGIHMSRLFLIAQQKLEKKPISQELLLNILKEIKNSHRGLSKKAFLDIEFEYMIQRPALKSDNTGWRFYPAKLSAAIDEQDELCFEVEVKLAYSSTCPCSAALARQLIQENFKNTYDGNSELSFDDIYSWLGKLESQVATPHSQRSYAMIKARSKYPKQELELINLIDNLEKIITTPVQAAVKREDEQEFARLNGRNFMFVEDAARRFKTYLESVNDLESFSGKVEHIESLHAHDAVAYFSG